MMSQPNDAEKPTGSTEPNTAANPDLGTLAGHNVSMAITFTIAGRSVVFVDAPSFDFALCARTRVSSEAQRWFASLEPTALDGEIQWVRQANRQVERCLRERSSGRDAPIQHLLEDDSAFAGDEFGWAEIIRQLAHATQAPSGFADIALVRFSEYLAAREAELLALRRRARLQPRVTAQAETEAEPAPPAATRPSDPLLLTEESDPRHSQDPLAGSHHGASENGAPDGVPPTSSPSEPPPADSMPDGAAGTALPSALESVASTRTGGVSRSTPQPPTRLLKGKREDVQVASGELLLLFCGDARIALGDDDALIESTGGAHLLAAGPNVIGRDSACDIILEGNRVSRMHVVVVAHGNGRYGLTDLSRNGTWYSHARARMAQGRSA